eukprot:7391348-Prymnesium_polylepis.1
MPMDLIRNGSMCELLPDLLHALSTCSSRHSTARHNASSTSRRSQDSFQLMPLAALSRMSIVSGVWLPSFNCTSCTSFQHSHDRFIRFALVHEQAAVGTCCCTRSRVSKSPATDCSTVPTINTTIGHARVANAVK